MCYLKELKRYFYAATAESEDTFLNDVFVTSADFKKIIEPISGTIRILVGSKGSGKSAILERLLKKSTELSIPAIRITPANLKDLNFEDNISPARIISVVRESVIKFMAVEYGKEKKGFLSESDNLLFQQAQNAGVSNQTLIDRLVTLLKPVGKGITDIDFEAICDSKSNTQKLIEGIKKQDKEKTFYILLDDIDQIASIERKDRNDIIWGVILALFSIAQELNNVFPIVTVRKEIWRQLTVDNGNRDKYDQIRSMVYELEPTRDDMKKIIEKRMIYCLQQIEGISHNYNEYSRFFDGKDCKLPSTNERRTWSDYLVASSRGNPRDIIQLVGHLVTNALNNGRNKIADIDVEDTALPYSKERFEDIINQNRDYCTGLDHIIRSFSKQNKFEFTAEEIKEHLLNALGGGRVAINNVTIQSTDIDSVFMLWDALSNIGFLNTQTIDNTQAKLYSFLPYDKSLIKISRWNDIQKYTWHIHPCYRSYLIDIQNQDKTRRLLMSQKININNSTKKKKKNKR